ncbi:MAG: phage portal protein family protein [Promethearchaeota archaeon]
MVKKEKSLFLIASPTQQEKLAYYNSDKYKSMINKANLKIKEEFKGEVSDKPIKFPKELGAAHPFNFKDAENLYKRYGLVAEIINKTAESVVGNFQVSFENEKSKQAENAKALVEDFLNNTNFSIVMKSWVTEALLKGNGFVELDLKNQKLRVMNANDMYVKRDKKGNVLEYNQYTGNINRFVRNSKKFINFKPNQIAHFTINKIPNDPYGIGVMWSNERIIDLIIQGESDNSKIMSRKAGSPIIAKCGQPGTAVRQEAIDSFKEKLQYMTNTTEWVMDGNVDMSVLEFKDLGKDGREYIMYLYRQLLAGSGMPEVLMGSGQLNEGIAKVQLEAYTRKIKALQKQAEKIIEEKIIKPLLNSQSPALDLKPTFIWNTPSQEEIDNQVMNIQKLLNTFGISENMRRMLEKKLGKLLELPDVDGFIQNPIPKAELEKKEKEEEEQEKERPPARKKDEDIAQPEVPGAKPTAKQSRVSEISKRIESGEVTLREYVNITEIPGFNYSDYLIDILKKLKTYKFDELRAITEKDIEFGLLPHKDIEKLRVIIREGFRKNLTIREIENEIKNSISLKDRKIIKDDKIIVTIKAENRPISIARTETVRMANLGLRETYIKNNIKRYRYLAAVDERTSDICLQLNGQVFPMDQATPGVNMPPMHPMCRSTIVGLID